MRRRGKSGTGPGASWRLEGVVMLVLALLLPCAAQASPPKTAHRALPWLHAQGTRLVDERGQAVLLKGLFLPNNTRGNWIPSVSEKLQREGKDPMIKPREQDAWVLTNRDFDIFSRLKLNFVVYDVNHELFEAGNPRRGANLAKLASHVRRFGALGIYVVINFAGSPGLNVNSTGEREKPGDKRQKSIFEDRALQDQHVAFLRTVVGKLKNESAVAGWLLTDEPLCPSDADGGVAAFQKAYDRFAHEVRALDPRHLIIAQGYNARERNPGEVYRDGASKDYKKDQGEQSIKYERKIVRLDPEIKNVAYDIHMFDPWFFVAEGAPDFDAADMERTLDGFARTVNDKFNAPLFITSYGVNRKQPSDKRIAWLDTIHGLFDKYGVSAAYFDYKDDVNPYGDQGGYMGVFGHYVRMNSHLRFEKGKYTFKDPDAKQAAQKRGTEILDKLFVRNGKPNPIACLDESVLAALQRYWSRP
jgi:endoglucanase